MRDHLHPTGRPDDDDNDFARRYSMLFHDLREKVRAFRSGTLQFTTKAHNYNASNVRTLGNNIYHTEIDIVLESADYLFVGEAKHESDLGTDGSANLVHQIIRQYVMVRILIERLGIQKTVIPFVVWDRTPVQRLPVQVNFMIDQGWMRSENVLEWCGIEALY